MPASGLKAASSEIYNTTLVITADAEVSVAFFELKLGRRETLKVKY